MIKSECWNILNDLVLVLHSFTILIKNVLPNLIVLYSMQNMTLVTRIVVMVVFNKYTNYHEQFDNYLGHSKTLHFHTK